MTMRLVVRPAPLTEEVLAQLEEEEGKIQELVVGTGYADFARSLKGGPFAGLHVEVHKHLAPRSWGAWV